MRRKRQKNARHVKHVNEVVRIGKIRKCRQPSSAVKETSFIENLNAFFLIRPTLPVTVLTDDFSTVSGSGLFSNYLLASPPPGFLYMAYTTACLLCIS